ncbi:HD domain-containing protein [Ruminococcaceae bacterium OttesenSCG-928-I18]|nr:HD domain-containing protein [Ruminococcaceae bacterium OttesenSCG-928-I18]
MKKNQYEAAEQFLHEHREPGFPDCLHSYRVLHIALCIAAEEQEVDYDVLILACLLHDVGRAALGAAAGHAVVGAEMAYSFLKEENWSENVANHVKNCIKTHSRKSLEEPESLEAKILYDADKLDMSGAVGCARMVTLCTLEQLPMYEVDERGMPLPGEKEEAPSLFREVSKRRKRGVSYYTKEGKRLGEKRQDYWEGYFARVKKEVKNMAKKGTKILDKNINDAK